MAPPGVVDGTIRARALVLAACCAIAAGCGGSGGSGAGSSAVPAAQHVCGRARAAARPLLGAVKLRIASSDPVDVRCVLSGGGTRVDVEAQATAQAWTEFETMTVHQSQAYGSGAVHVPGQLPQPVPGLSGNAAWIPAREELVATNGTESTGGSYVTVEITRSRSRGPTSLSLARAVARAVLAVAPRGPSPGAPPS